MNSSFRTIVGGRSEEYRDRNNFPRGIEILLKKSKVDTQFKTKFLKDPLEAAISIQLELKANEKKILENTPKPLLETMIENTFVPKHHVKTFLTAKTAAMLALILASTVIAPTYLSSAGVQEETETVEEIYLAEERMRAIQDALEQYKLDYGTYPSTEEWLSVSNPLEDYIPLSNIYDPWKRKFYYRTIKKDGQIVNYTLESLGENGRSYHDNVPCPIDTDIHSDFKNNPLQIQFPLENDIIQISKKEDGPDSTVVLQAVHEIGNVDIAWYIDGEKIGSTLENHSLEYTIPETLSIGPHHLFLIDKFENNVAIHFYIERED